ncbi:MAG: GPW/gp25 family protein [Anaerolineaceae bacterium]
MQREQPHLGKGLAFPLQVNARHEFALSEAERDIEQSIRIILGTRPGERVMRPTFGCRVYELLFEPRDSTTFSMLRKYVEDALAFWEPRITVLSVNPTLDENNDSSIYVEIEYRIKETHDLRSIVYPFFLVGEEEW